MNLPNITDTSLGLTPALATPASAPATWEAKTMLHNCKERIACLVTTKDPPSHNGIKKIIKKLSLHGFTFPEESVQTSLVISLLESL